MKPHSTATLASPALHVEGGGGPTDFPVYLGCSCGEDVREGEGGGCLCFATLEDHS